MKYREGGWLHDWQEGGWTGGCPGPERLPIFFFVVGFFFVFVFFPHKCKDTNIAIAAYLLKRGNI